MPYGSCRGSIEVFDQVVVVSRFALGLEHVVLRDAISVLVAVVEERVERVCLPQVDARTSLKALGEHVLQLPLGPQGVLGPPSEGGAEVLCCNLQGGGGGLRLALGAYERIFYTLWTYTSRHCD